MVPRYTALMQVGMFTTMPLPGMNTLPITRRYFGGMSPLVTPGAIGTALHGIPLGGWVLLPSLIVDLREPTVRAP